MLVLSNAEETEILSSIAKLRESFGLKPDALAIIVSPAQQRLYVVRNHQVIKSYPVSTSKNGLGNREGSEKTPPGVHRIKEKIGDGAPSGAIFKGRVNTGKIAKIYTDETDTPEDLATTRIMWLDGQEDGINRGKGIDSHARYIYIHGTPEEGLIGGPQSRGCIRMKNADVIELFNLAPEGTLVDIWARNQDKQRPESEK